MFENDVDPIPSLQTFKNQVEQFKIHTGTGLTYEQYSELLISAAIIHDKEIQVGH